MLQHFLGKEIDLSWEKRKRGRNLALLERPQRKRFNGFDLDAKSEKTRVENTLRMFFSKCSQYPQSL